MQLSYGLPIMHSSGALAIENVNLPDQQNRLSGTAQRIPFISTTRPGSKSASQLPLRKDEKLHLRFPKDHYLHLMSEIIGSNHK